MIRLNIQDKGIYKIIVKMQNKELFLKRVFLAVKPTPDVSFLFKCLRCLLHPHAHTHNTG